MSSLSAYEIVCGAVSPTQVVNDLVSDTIEGVPESWLIASIGLTDRIDAVLEEADEQFDPYIEWCWDSRAETTTTVAPGTDVHNAKPSVVKNCVQDITAANFGIELSYKEHSLLVDVQLLKTADGYDVAFLNPEANDKKIAPSIHLTSLSTAQLRKAVFSLLSCPLIQSWSKPKGQNPIGMGRVTMPWDNFPGGRLAWENWRSGGNI